jgi:hypothetical protein
MRRVVELCFERDKLLHLRTSAYAAEQSESVAKPILRRRSGKFLERADTVRIDSADIGA